MFALGKSLSSNNPFSRQEGGVFALKLLTLINLINYGDRLVASSLKSELQSAFNLNDFQSTFPGLGMAVCFTIFAGIFGWLNDKRFVDRRIIVAAGVAFWSAMTCLTASSNSFALLIIFRSLVGVGEASYGTVAGPILFDFFPVIDRNVAYGIYFLAVPIGSAIGYGLGGVVGSALGWRWAFIVFGIPGFVFAYAILKINDPVRGINDPNGFDGKFLTVTDENRVSHHTMSTVSVSSLDCEMNTYEMAVISEKVDLQKPTSPPIGDCISPSNSTPNPNSKQISTPLSGFAEILLLLTNSQFMLSVIGLAASSFGLNGLGDFLPLFLHRKHNFSVATAGN